MSTAVIEVGIRSQRRTTSRPAAPLQLTRRGQLVVRFTAMLVLLALVMVAMTMLSAPAESTDRPTHYAAATVVVAPGETLWDIAAVVAPQEDRRGVIADIVKLNSLPDAGAIVAGQSLFVPTY